MSNPLGKLTLLWALSFAVGCGPDLTQKNIDRLVAGVSEKEVIEMLGSPKETEHVEIYVHYDASGVSRGGVPMKLVRHTWYGANTGVRVGFDEDKRLLVQRMVFSHFPKE